MSKFLDKIIERAKTDKQKIVLPEGSDIRTVQAAMDGYDPSVVGYRWDDENPCIQLEPRGQRGYIELRAVRRLEQ